MNTMIQLGLHSIYRKHKSFWNKKRIASLIQSLVLFGLALIFQKVADDYVMETNGTPVGDILLNNIPSIPIHGTIMVSTLIYTAVVISLHITRPGYIIFTIKSVALFVTIRAFFISLTHL